MLSLIFPTQGNPVALKRTLDSTKNVVDEIIIGSVCVFKEDVALIESYKSEYNIKIVHLPFNHIFCVGFSDTLNLLASHAANPVCIYLNVGEVIEKGEENILKSISPEYNCYYIDHSVERHRWWRVFCPKEMKWSGILHEEIIGDNKPFHKPLFTFGDTNKDMEDLFKARVYDDIKEILYFSLYNKIVDEPDRIGATDMGWHKFASENYDSMKERLLKKGKRYEAFIEGDLDKYLYDIMNNPEFEKERFESSIKIEFQQNPMFLNK